MVRSRQAIWSMPGAAVLTPVRRRAADVAGGGQSGDAGTPAAQPSMHPIALRMSECEVVRAVGPPQDVQIGVNERGDRAGQVAIQDR